MDNSGLLVLDHMDYDNNGPYHNLYDNPYCMDQDSDALLYCMELYGL